MKRGIKKYLLVIISSLLFGGIGFSLGFYVKSSRVVISQAIREQNTAYDFINPLLAVNRPDTKIPTTEYKNLYTNIQKYIAEKKKLGLIKDVSIYFIQYKKGDSFMINANEPYVPASLLKVVIMVGYLKESESRSGVLSQKFTYAPSLLVTEPVPFEAPTTLVSGKEYSVSELINRMIIDSDNGAMNVLLAHIDDAYLSEVYSELGLHAPDGITPYTISAKEYSLFFRILYNATYLSRANSEKALAILSKATFSEGLTSGVPESVVVAHKFGEHVSGSKGRIDEVELHDCGIVYAENPYLLCVMTRGAVFDSLKETIGDISKMIFTEVASQ